MTWSGHSMALLAAPFFVLITGGTASAAVDCTAAGTWCGTYVPAVTGNTDAAAAQFSITPGTSSSTLTVVLTNTSTFASGSYSNPDVLSGVFFDIAGGQQTLTGSSATASNLITLNKQGQVTTTTPLAPVDSGWGWKYSGSGYSSANLATSARYGIAAAGYNLLSPNFGHSNFGTATSTSLGGMDYGVVGTNFTSLGGNSSPLEEDSVTFVFSGLSSGITLSDISNVTFSYGTNPDGSSGATTTTTTTGGGTPVPEPASLAVLAVGLLGLTGARARRARR